MAFARVIAGPRRGLTTFGKEINQIQFFNLFFENTLSLCFVDEDATIIKPWGKCGTRVDAK